MVRRRGFSLIELLVVIALIGILTAIATASYSTMQKKARDSRRVSDMKAIQNGYEQYFADHQSTYPSGTCYIDTTYLPSGFPVDPKSGFNYSLDCPDGITYCFCAALEVDSGNEPTDCAGVAGAGNFYCVHERQ